MSAVSGWGPVERDQSNGDLAADDGAPLRLRGVTYAKGLGMHAVADVRYALGGGCQTPIGALATLQRNLLIYGVGGVIIPFIGIKVIDVVITARFV